MSLTLKFEAGWKLNPTKKGAFRPSTHPTKKTIALPQERSFFYQNNLKVQTADFYSSRSIA
ncbi:MAG TPA: hypothetical protein IGS17_06035 [Oscillatoriales cyanobacterium M59_W2019_021]|nr:MAG: hypothetical protein D6728_04030 [Cyanobacteria bacterium J055]HIK33155.1 hypothetical protein [Oscillatoriales cyanobacterium M4454_W2019_049]HIK50472.1 hypothetical protein [Oscillatoriales cyanobacterium M59_W2019_021]